MPSPLSIPLRSLAAAAVVAAAGALAGCSPLSLAVTAAGVATDTSVTWDIVKHVHGQITADDPTPCVLLDGLHRALNPRCEYTPGRISRAALASPGLQECPLATATRDPRLWRALPELLEQGADETRCAGSPLLRLAAVDACPDFTAAPAPVRRALATLAERDPRAVRHDVMRMFSCPAGRAAGLDAVLVGWFERGDLAPDQLSFSPFGALHPDMLVGSPLAVALEAAGHRPGRALDAYDGMLAPGFDEALRTSNWAALDWWLARLPKLARIAPPSRGGQLAWVPLQRVLVADFLAYPETQRDMVRFLLARGADPKERLPFDRSKTVLAWARQAKSPMLAVLEPPATRSEPPLRQATVRSE